MFWTVACPRGHRFRQEGSWSKISFYMNLFLIDYEEFELSRLPLTKQQATIHFQWRPWIWSYKLTLAAWCYKQKLSRPQLWRPCSWPHFAILELCHRGLNITVVVLKCFVKWIQGKDVMWQNRLTEAGQFDITILKSCPFSTTVHTLLTTTASLLNLPLSWPSFPFWAKILSKPATDLTVSTTVAWLHQ